MDQVHLLDPASGKTLCPIYPVNKAANYNNGRKMKQLSFLPEDQEIPEGKEEIAPLLLKILGEQAATGLPPAY